MPGSFLRGFGLLLLVLAASGAASPSGSPSARPALTRLAVSNGDSPFAGDRRLLTTISPNRDGFRDRAEIHFRLREVATVTVVVNRTTYELHPIFVRRARFGAGAHVIVWAPPAAILPRTYLVRLVVRDRRGRTWRYGSTGPSVGKRTGPVVRVQGVDAAFWQDSYRSGAVATLRIATDASSLTLQLYHCGPEFVPKPLPGSMSGQPVGDPVEIPWRWRSGSHAIRVPIGDVVSGLYFAELTASDGRVGFAPFVVRPGVLGAVARVAVVLPTYTWQAYNFDDADGDGWGDTWYAGPGRPPRVALHRPFLDRGVPPGFAHYDRDFLHWVAWGKHAADFLSDSDLERFESGEQLARLYRLIVFAGHDEYVSGHVYGLVRRFRNLGGNLVFLAADNFYWRVARRGNAIVRTTSWRGLGRPEAALVGAQFAGGDRGAHQGAYVVRRAGAAPWLFRNTGLRNGSRFGHFGIEVDEKAPSSPPGTVVLARIPGRGGARTAQMTYSRRAAARRSSTSAPSRSAGRRPPRR
jgi:N,N-dimethylformamidase beta subunit-like protein